MDNPLDNGTWFALLINARELNAILSMSFASSKHAYLGAMANLRSIWRKEQNNKLRLLHRDLVMDDHKPVYLNNYRFVLPKRVVLRRKSLFLELHLSWKFKPVLKRRMGD